MAQDQPDSSSDQPPPVTTSPPVKPRPVYGRAAFRSDLPETPQQHLDIAAQLLRDGERYIHETRQAHVRALLAQGHIHHAQVSASISTPAPAIDPHTNEPPAIRLNEHGGVDTGALLATFRMRANEALTSGDTAARRLELLSKAVLAAQQLDRALGVGAPLPQAWGEMQHPHD